MTPTQHATLTRLKRHFSRSITMPRHAGDAWRNDLQAPITSRRKRHWIARACLALLAATAGLTWVWFYW
jgi:hypothetical protein